jgi:hypothetical protein
VYEPYRKRVEELVGRECGFTIEAAIYYASAFTPDVLDLAQVRLDEGRISCAPAKAAIHLAVCIALSRSVGGYGWVEYFSWEGMRMKREEWPWACE